MSNLDDFIKSISIFKGGLQEYQQNKAMNQAAEQVQQLAQVEDEKLRMQQMTQLQNELNMRLVGSGMDPGKAAVATANLAPSAGAQFQAGENKDLQKSSQDFNATEAQKDRDLNRELARMQMEAAQGKFGTKLTKDQMSFIKNQKTDFDKLATKPKTALQNLTAAENALKSNNPIADKSLPTFLARATGEVGNLTEEERRPFGGSQAMQARISQAAKELADGKLTPQNKAFIKQLIGVYRKSHEQNILRAREEISSRAEKMAEFGGYALSKDQIGQMLHYLDEPAASPQTSQQMQPVSPNQPQAGGLMQYLKD